MKRSYSELQRADDITAHALAPYGLGRPSRETVMAAGALSAGVLFTSAPMVRIRFPPAASLQTTGP
jgi:hypothetical protein